MVMLICLIHILYIKAIVTTTGNGFICYGPQLVMVLFVMDNLKREITNNKFFSLA
jgi:hypothetical protein